MSRTPAPTTLASILSNCETDEATGCQLWCGAHTKAGYGEIVVNREVRYTHDAVYELFTGRSINFDIPDDGSTRFEIHHICGRRGCCNPFHLLRFSQRQHMKLHQQLRREREITCVHGHRWTPENTIELANGSRICRLCRDERAHGILPPKQPRLMADSAPLCVTAPYPILPATTTSVQLAA